MFKLLKKGALDSLIAKTKSLGLSSRSQSSHSSKPGTPKEVETSDITLAAGSKESLKESKDSLHAESVSGSALSLNISQKQQLSPIQQDLTEAKNVGELDGDGVLSIRIVESRNLHLPRNLVLPFLVLEFDKNETMAWAKEAGPGHSLNWNFKTSFDVSRAADVTVTVFQKNQARTGDSAIGTVRISPSFNSQKLEDDWYKLFPVGMQLSSTGTTPQISVGEIRLQISFRKNNDNGQQSLSVDDFEILKVLGKGSFGKVVQVRKKDTGRIYAMKILKKSSIVERDEVQHTLAERNVLAKVNHPFIVNIKFSFQTKEKLYLVLAFVNGGELFHHLQIEGRFEESRARMYAAELLSALECLHSFNIIYRDLKPENILLDYTGHIALCDFGLCKFNMKDGHTTNTFCGTPEYLAPEILLGLAYTKSVDWWTLGILIYEMLTGLPPFYDENQNDMYKKIIGADLLFPDELGDYVKDLLGKMLIRDASKRLGADGAEEIKRHPWFADINWQKLDARKYKPVFRPEVANAYDTSNFDEEFTSEVPQDSYVDPCHHLEDSQQNQFEGFSYRGDPLGSMQVGSMMNNLAGSIPRSVRKEGNLRRWE